MDKFELDPALARDSDEIADLGLCQLRLNNDRRWPWLILVPQRLALVEVFDLTPVDQTMLHMETAMTGKALKKVTGATKINIAAIGNIVRQLHVHVIARFEGDDNWPNPVWGHGTRQPWGEDDKHAFMKNLLEAL